MVKGAEHLLVFFTRNKLRQKGKINKKGGETARICSCSIARTKCAQLKQLIFHCYITIHKKVLAESSGVTFCKVYLEGLENPSNGMKIMLHLNSLNLPFLLPFLLLKIIQANRLSTTYHTISN